MSPWRAVLWLGKGVAQLALLAALVGIVAWAVLPGGPLDAGLGVDDPPETTTAPRGEPREAGETATPPPRPLSTGPWERRAVTVGVRNRADPSRNVTAAVAEALDFWDRNAGYGDYAVEFRLRPDAVDPDVIVWYNETISCPAHDDAIGCAPLLDGSVEVDQPVAVQVRYDPADNHRQVRNTVIHEFGHVLGITHCEEPHWVMASACDEPLPDAPDVTERDLAWLDETLAVYVDDANVSDDELAETRAQVDHALAYFEEGRAEGFPANVTFVGADSRYEADVVVTFTRERTCGGDNVACYSFHGRDYDGDGRREYYSRGTIRIDADADVDARGWFVGSAMANLLSPGHVPPEFEDASYEERRSRWWE